MAVKDNLEYARHLQVLELYLELLRVLAVGRELVRQFGQ
jgi:hypothetical protein